MDESLLSNYGEIKMNLLPGPSAKLPAWRHKDWKPLRQRKKNRIRTSILETAKELFAERGYKAVTVAEIADRADVSVKTLFTYFRSKEDLAFQDELLLCQDLLDAIESRDVHISLFDAVSKFYQNLVSSIHPETLLESLPGFHPWMEDIALEQRFLLLFSHYEERIAEVLEQESLRENQFSKEEPEVGYRNPIFLVLSSQIVSILRALGSKDFKEYLRPVPIALRPRALEKWLHKSLQLVGGGIRQWNQI
ncbi:MAG: helix-turn-helix domain containing protein [Leptospira sp.]|nr:helix-turn-helix domain containing protein [Leptospira sp.]